MQKAAKFMKMLQGFRIKDRNIITIQAPRISKVKNTNRCRGSHSGSFFITHISSAKKFLRFRKTHNETKYALALCIGMNRAISGLYKRLRMDPVSVEGRLDMFRLSRRLHGRPASPEDNTLRLVSESAGLSGEIP